MKTQKQHFEQQFAKIFLRTNSNQLISSQQQTKEEVKELDMASSTTSKTDISFKSRKKSALKEKSKSWES